MKRFFFLLFFFPVLIFFSVPAYSTSCSNTGGDWGTWNSTSISQYDCESDWQAAFDGSSDSEWGTGPYVCTTSHPYCIHVSNIPTGALMYFTASDGSDSDLTVYVLCPDGCCAEQQALMTECGGAGLYSIDYGTCEGACNPDPCEDVDPKPEEVCGDIEQVVWDNVDTCEFHCDQGECEDEYQAAKLECDNPRLISSASCEYSCDCSDAVPAAEAACPYDYFMNEDCTYDCKCCGDIIDDCIQACGGSDNVGSLTCDEDQDAEDNCTVTFASDCNCTVPPIREPEPEPEPGDPDSEKQPAPDPEDDPDNDKTCFEWHDACSSDCQFSCATDPVTGKVQYHTCDCGDDPDGDPDDGANGWLKKIEDNTDKTAEGVEKSNKWLKAIKHNTDTQIELDKDRNQDLDNISENTRRSVENQKAINATLQKGNALTEDGNDYLRIIAGKNFSSSSSVNVDFPEEITTEGTSGVALNENIYSATFTEEEGFAPIPEDGAEGSFSKGLSDYIATGIPLISYIEGMSINLSSSSPVLNMMFWGRPVNVDFSAYVSVIDLVGNILFALSIISGFMLIIARIKS